MACPATDHTHSDELAFRDNLREPLGRVTPANWPFDYDEKFAAQCAS